MKLYVIVIFMIYFIIIFVNSSENVEESQSLQLLEGCSTGNIELVSQMLSQKVNVNIKDSKSGLTPLMWAVNVGSIDIIQKLLANGAEIELTSTDGHKTALILACYQNKVDIVEFLLIYGANVNAKNSRGDTAISTAVYKSNYNVVKTLLKRNPNLEIKTLKHGYTPLHFAAINCDHKIFNLLVRHNAKVNSVDLSNKSPLDIIKGKCESLNKFASLDEL